MGHAGAIVSGADESAATKKKVIGESGIPAVESPATIGAKVKEVLGQGGRSVGAATGSSLNCSGWSDFSKPSGSWFGSFAP